MHSMIRVFALRLTAGLLTAGLCLAACQSAYSQHTPLRVVVLGAHPDDPESGPGGLIVSLTNAGCQVDVGYMVCYRQGRTYFGRPEAEVRREEATAACEIMNATPHFFDYAAGDLAANTATLNAVSTWLGEVQPDIVVTQWPDDTHPDHVATGEIATQLYHDQSGQGGWNLYYFEVNTNLQTLNFHPELYLDIAAVRNTKQQAVMCHLSQNPTLIWQQNLQMQLNRGAECGVEYAEAYSLLEARPGGALLPVQFLSPVPEPSSGVLLTVGGLIGLSCLVWRKRQ